MRWISSRLRHAHEPVSEAPASTPPTLSFKQEIGRMSTLWRRLNFARWEAASGKSILFATTSLGFFNKAGS
jgi:hypothetical protein